MGSLEGANGYETDWHDGEVTFVVGSAGDARLELPNNQTIPIADRWIPIEASSFLRASRSITTAKPRWFNKTREVKIVYWNAAYSAVGTLRMEFTNETDAKLFYLYYDVLQYSPLNFATGCNPTYIALDNGTPTVLEYVEAGLHIRRKYLEKYYEPNMQQPVYSSDKKNEKNMWKHIHLGTDGISAVGYGDVYTVKHGKTLMGRKNKTTRTLKFKTREERADWRKRVNCKPKKYKR